MFWDEIFESEVEVAHFGVLNLKFRCLHTKFCGLFAFRLELWGSGVYSPEVQVTLNFWGSGALILGFWGSSAQT